MKKLSTKIRISELADVSARLVALFKGEKSLAEDVFLKPLFAQIEEKSVALSVAIKKESVISKLDELDGLRDDTIRDLRSALAGYASLRTAEIKESAEQLLAIFDRYGLKIVKENFSEESGHIESMLRDFSEAPAKALVEKLGGIKEILQELQERQSAFNTERVAYEKTLSVVANLFIIQRRMIIRPDVSPNQIVKGVCTTPLRFFIFCLCGRWFRSSRR